MGVPSSEGNRGEFGTRKKKSVVAVLKATTKGLERKGTIGRNLKPVRLSLRGPHPRKKTVFTREKESAASKERRLER